MPFESESQGYLEDEPGLLHQLVQDLYDAPKLSKSAQNNHAWTYHAYRFVEELARSSGLSPEIADEPTLCDDRIIKAGLPFAFPFFGEHTRPHERKHRCQIDTSVPQRAPFHPPAWPAMVRGTR